MPDRAYSEPQTCQQLSEGMVLSWHTIAPILQIGCLYSLLSPGNIVLGGRHRYLEDVEPLENFCEWWAQFVIVQPL